MRVHHGGVELIGADLSFGGDHHVGHHHQSVDRRIERAQAIAELLRQHRNHAPREIHRGRAVLRLAIDRAAWLHIVADIGDGDDQPPLPAALVHRLAVDGVVEVARVLAVDRHERHIAQVHPLLQVLRQNRSGKLHRLGDHLRRKLVRHGELAYRDLDLHAGIVDRAEHLNHAPHRLHMPLRLLHDLDDHDLPRLRVHRCARRYQDVVRDALVLGHDDRDAALVEKATDKTVGAVFDDLDDLAFLAPAPVEPGRPRQHAVAVQHLAHLVLGQRQIRTAVVADEKAEAVAMALHLARYQIGARRHQQQSGAVAHDAAGALQFEDFCIEARAACVGNAEALRQFFRRQRRARLGQFGKQLIAACCRRCGRAFRG
jgi:hypothetical protein